MAFIGTILRFAAQYGRYTLLVGLLVGLFAPGLAAYLAQYIPQFAVLLIFVAMLRLPDAGATDIADGVRQTMPVVLVMQLVCPVLLMIGAAAFGILSVETALALILIAAAPPIVGSPNFAALMGFDTRVSMQLLLLGMVMMPLTVLPVLWFFPGLGSATAILTSIAKLIGILMLGVGAGYLVQRRFFRDAEASTKEALDGLSAITLSVFVVALMSAVGNALFDQPSIFFYWLALSFAVNFGAQFAICRWGENWLKAHQTKSIAFASGNRNLSLYFAALPAEVMAPFLILLGCYQIPMFLSPLLLQRLYR